MALDLVLDSNVEHKMLRTAIIAGAACVVLSGCGGTPEVSSTPEDPPMQRAHHGRTLDEVIALVREDAGRREGVAAEAVRVLSAKAVTWPDGSLGCPQPGMAYTQALAPGYQVVVRAGEQTHDYHASTTGRLLLCPPGRAQVPAVGGQDR